MTDEDVRALKCSSPTSFLPKPTSEICIIVLTLLIFLLFTFRLPPVTGALLLCVHGFPVHHQLQLPHSWRLCFSCFISLLTGFFIRWCLQTYSWVLYSQRPAHLWITLCFIDVFKQQPGVRKFGFHIFFFKTKCRWRSVDIATLSFGIEHYR